MGLAGVTGLAALTGEFGVLTVLGVFGVFTVFGSFGVLGVFDVSTPVPVVGAGVAGVEVESLEPVLVESVVVSVVEPASSEGIEATPTDEPTVSWMLMAWALATAPPLSSPTPSTEAAPIAVHFFLASIVTFPFIRGVLQDRRGAVQLLVVPILFGSDETTA